MPETQDDEYSALAAAIGGQVDAMLGDAPETPAIDPAASSETPDTLPPDETPVVEAATLPTDEPTPEDPLAGSEPLTYKVDGEVRTIDGAYNIPGVGAVIPTELLPSIQDRLGQADRLHAINKTQYETIQRFEQAGGHEALQALAVEKAQSEAAAVVMLQTLLDNPDVLAQIALAENREARQAILNTTVLREARLAAREARLNTTDRPATPPIDITDPATRETVLTNGVAQVAQQYAADFPGLTPEDIAHVNGLAKRYAASLLTPATPDEAKAARVKPGETILQLPLLHEMLKERATWRASQASLASKATDAAKQNAARLAAASKAKQTPVKPAVAAPAAAAEPSWEDMKSKWAAGQFATASPD